MMDAADFEQVYDGFQEFHSFFAPAFGRKQWRERSRNYLQALLVQAGERRNAENLSESVGVSARVLQRFLTEARWDDDAVMGRLQEYLAPRLAHPEAVWVFDGSDFPKQGRKSAGVARQYCGRLGKVANCQAGVFLAYVSPLGRALVDKRLYLPQVWASDDARCQAAAVPEDRRGYRSKAELALEMLARARERDHLRAKWVAGDDAFGMSPSFREGLTALGMWYVLDVPGGTTVWPLEPSWTSPDCQGFGRPRKPRLVDGQRRTVAERSDALPEGAWREITVAEGSQGRRTYRFSARRVRVPRGASPGRSYGPSGDVTWTAASPATTCPTHRRILPWRPWLMWAGQGGVLKRSSRRKRATWVWTNTRPALGRAGITTSPCACWAGRSCWACSRSGGKKMPRITRPQVYRVVREMLPREQFGPDELLLWLGDTQLRNERARRSHEKRRSTRREGRPEPPP